MAESVDVVYRDHNTAGVPASGDYKPKKPEIRALLKQIQNSGGMSVTRNTFTALSGVTPPTENYMGVVLDDTDPTKNGYYSRVAAAWVWERGFPDTFAKLTLAGTGAARTATVGGGVNPADIEVFFASVNADNTGAITLAVSGGTARDVVNAAGNPLAAGEWTGVVMFFLNEDGDYQLINDAGAAAAAAASATAADEDADRAEAAASVASGAMTTLLDPQFATLSTAQAYSPVAAPDYIRTAGHTAAGDGGGALYKKVASEPAHEGKFSITLSDAVTVVWYELAENTRFALQYGVGDTAFTTGLQAAVDASTSGGLIRIPEGTFTLTDTIDCGGHSGLYISGSGVRATTINFAPGADKTAIKFGRLDGFDVQCGISDLKFHSSDTTHIKKAIEVLNLSQMNISRVSVGPTWTDNSTFLPGDDTSVGIETRGREFVLIEDYYCGGDVGIRIRNNPAAGALDLSCDHFLLRNIYITGQGSVRKPCILVDDDVYLSNFRLEGKNPLVAGSNAFKWVAPTTPQASHNVVIEGIRSEQSLSAAEYAIDIDLTGAPGRLQSLSIKDCYLGHAQQGLRLKNIQRIGLEDVMYIGAAGRTAINANLVDEMEIQRCFWQVGGNAILTGLYEKERRSLILAGAPLASSVYFTNNADASQMQMGVNQWKWRGTVAVGAGNIKQLPQTTPSGRRSAIITVAGVNAGGTIAEGGVVFDSPVGAVKLSGTTYFGTGNVPGSLTVFNTGSTVSIFNQTVDALDVMVTVDWI